MESFIFGLAIFAACVIVAVFAIAWAFRSKGTTPGENLDVNRSTYGKHGPSSNLYAGAPAPHRAPLRPSYPPQTRPRAVEPVKRSDDSDLVGGALLYGMVASVSHRYDDPPGSEPVPTVVYESGQGGDFGGGGASSGWDNGSSDSSSSDSGSSSSD